MAKTALEITLDELEGKEHGIILKLKKEIVARQPKAKEILDKMDWRRQQAERWAEQLTRRRYSELDEDNQLY